MTNPSTRPLACIVLAAGHGTRMRSPQRHKVTYPVLGVPVIRSAVETYRNCGVERIVMVVGVLSHQVRAALKDADSDVDFRTQAEQRGTGNAARVGADALRMEGFDGDILVVAGDKVISPNVIERLCTCFREQDADLALVVGRADDSPNAGRMVMDGNGHPVRIMEAADIAREVLFASLKRDAPVLAEEAGRRMTDAFGSEAKAARAVPLLWERVEAGKELSADDIPDPDRIALEAGAAEWVNLSVYMFRASALYEALDALGSNNAQGEEYLTDALGILSGKGRRIIVVPVDDSTDVLAFNTPEEYAAVRLNCESTADGPVSERLARKTLPGTARRTLEAFAVCFGDSRVSLVRAPGRLNLMGRHIDHQGGAGNLIAIDRSAWLATAKRGDRRVILHNADTGFPDRDFHLDELGAGAVGNWPAFVNSDSVRETGLRNKGDWSMYIRAACARLEAFAGRPLCGMNIAAAGDIPIAAGLSSSSALVVAAAETIVALNGLAVTRERLVELCGEAEWYVGTRGGAGDHAAMILGQAGHVTQVGYFPFRATGVAPMPQGFTFVVFDSGIPARKTAEARQAFNSKVACCHIGRELLKRALPEHAARIVHLRDVNAAHLGLEPVEIVRALSALPVSMTAREAGNVLSPEARDSYLADARPNALYPVRPVVVFELAECARSASCLELLREGDVETFGRWMTVSHDGDRVSPKAILCDDHHMSRWLASAISNQPGAELTLQSGGYSCSLPQLDAMVDIALSQPGVKGAQLSGAGLGGCIMALVASEAVDALEAAMESLYYKPAGIPPRVIRCSAVEGSGLI